MSETKRDLCCVESQQEIWDGMLMQRCALPVLICKVTVLHCTGEIGVCQILVCCIISDNRRSVVPPRHHLPFHIGLPHKKTRGRTPLKYVSYYVAYILNIYARWKTGKLLCGRQPGRSRQLVLSEYFIVNHFPSESWKLFKSEVSYFCIKVTQIIKSGVEGEMPWGYPNYCILKMTTYFIYCMNILTN